MTRVVAVVGNPRPASRTHRAALQLRDAIADRTASVASPTYTLMLELGAGCPARGLYVTEAELGDFEARARAFARSIR